MPMPFEELVAEPMNWRMFVTTIILIVVMALPLYAAIIPAAIAQRKGYNFWLVYVFGVVAWLVAILVVLLLPENKVITTPMAVRRAVKRCINCQTENGADAYFCARCGAAFAAT